MSCVVTITGSKQGKFKGESVNANEKDSIPVLAYGYEVVFPRDPVTGQPTGKRQHRPVTFVKAWGAATPQIFQALVTNEVLTTVVFDFTRVNPQGKAFAFERVTLTNASISGQRQYTETTATGVINELEQVSLTFQKITLQNNDGNTSASDDWRAPTA